MKASFVTFAALVGFASAQLDLPACARQCATDLTTGGTISGCQLSNVKCICENGGFLANIACCLTAGCSQEDQVKAASQAAIFCRNVAGVTNLPTAVVCSTSSTAAATAAPSSTAPSSSTVTSAGGSTTSTGSAASAAASSGASSVSSILSSITSGVVASSSPTPTNAAAQNAAGVGAGALALAALLL